MTATTRDALISAAAELMDEGGLSAVTLRAVGHRAGVSHNAPYKHFADKEQLLAAVAARELDRHRAALASLSGRHGSGADAVKAMMQAYVRWAQRHPVRFRLTFGAWSTDSPELGAAASATRVALVDAVTRAQADGTLPTSDPERLAALLQATAHGAVDLALAGHLSPTGKGHAAPDDLADDLVAYLQAATPASRRRSRAAPQ